MDETKTVISMLRGCFQAHMLNIDPLCQTSPWEDICKKCEYKESKRGDDTCWCRYELIDRTIKLLEAKEFECRTARDSLETQQMYIKNLEKALKGR